MSFIYMFNHVMPLSSDGFLETEQELITISFSQSYSCYASTEGVTKCNSKGSFIGASLW